MSEQEVAPISTSCFFITLLCDEKPTLDQKVLLRHLQAIDSAFEPLGVEDLCIFVNERYTLRDIAGERGSPVVVAVAEGIDWEEVEEGVSQSWDWPQAGEKIAQCQYAVLINDMSGDMLKPRDRLENLQKVLAAVLPSVPVKGVHWPTAQQIVDPEMVKDALSGGQFDGLFNGAVNVRMFRVEGKDEIVMDTLGLAYFGLPDLQCHYQKLEPRDVAARLYGVAAYLFDKGLVIESGHTIDGCDGRPWECSFQWSLVAPARQVIDLHAGMFAGGDRK